MVDKHPLIRCRQLPLPGLLLGLLVLTASGAQGQTLTPEPSAAATELKPVTVTGAAPDETQSRRQSTASKIIVGREEIERFGDTTMGELLKRLPGVTVPGRPGRGGAPRMRGLGGGYTRS
jgi:iron complex outermembrane receptor protein